MGIYSINNLTLAGMLASANREINPAQRRVHEQAKTDNQTQQHQPDSQSAMSHSHINAEEAGKRIQAITETPTFDNDFSMLDHFGALNLAGGLTRGGLIDLMA